MPVCKNCNARISKFDKDRCPVCGFVNPFSSENSDTVEITSDITIENALKKNVRIKKKSICLLLSLLTPFVGTPYFYLRLNKKGLVWLIVNVLLISLLFCVFFFLVLRNNDQKLFYSILISLLTPYLFNIALGISFVIKKDYKDGNGELVR